jgi:hypothetical protein
MQGKLFEEEKKDKTFSEGIHLRTLDEVLELKKQLERRSGCKLDLSRSSLL